jgi:hypothetical protein
LLVLVGAVIATYVGVVRRRPPAWMFALLLAGILPLSENLLLAQHAATYHFDRLKALVPIALVSSLLIAMLPSPVRQRAVVGWFAVLTLNLTWTVAHARQNRSMDVAQSVGPSMASNTVLLAHVHDITRPCAVFATNAEPRAWVELSLGANTYGGVPSADSVQRLVAARGGCQGIYMVMARAPGAAVYIWRRAIVFDATTGVVDTLEWSDSKAAQ